MRAIWRSVAERQGKLFAVVFSRQAGKDESLAQLVVAILSRYRIAGGSIIIGAPTLAQAQITITRIYDRAMLSPATAPIVQRSGDTVTIGRASVTAASAEPS